MTSVRIPIRSASAPRAVARLVLLAIALMALLLTLAPAADAQRRPTKDERVAIANAVGVPKRCLVTRVSTVNRRWSVAWMKRCKLGGGAAVFRFRRGLWRDSYTGPDEPRGLRCREIDYVRTKVARDLKLCR